MTPLCPDCRIEMALGTMLDFSHGAVLQPRWQPGPPEAAKFLGIPISGGVKPDKLHMLPAVAWRCPQCGLLRLYANAAETPSD